MLAGEIASEEPVKGQVQDLAVRAYEALLNGCPPMPRLNRLVVSSAKRQLPPGNARAVRAFRPGMGKALVSLTLLNEVT
jgi:hypothetical protein